METKERITALLECYGLSVNEFVARTGIKTRQAIYDIYHGKTRNISESMACKILSCYPEVNRVWLLTGEGEMLKSNMTTKDRLFEFISKKNLKVSAFERQCGLSNGFCSKVNDNVKDGSLSLIAKGFPELNLLWLKTGEGEMLNTPAPVQQDGENVVIPGKVWKVIEKQADSLAAKDKQIDDLIAVIKESQKKDTDAAHQGGSATSAVVG